VTWKSIPPTHSLAATLLLALAAGPAAAQYKWTGPDGKVVYGDRPPAAVSNAKPVTTNVGMPPAAPALPWSLQQVADRYPVTLYASPDCGPCDIGRKHLQTRGIPYIEKMLTKHADFEAFKALGFTETLLPAMTVGRQRSIGFNAGAWNALLDAAGYPASSALPRGWKPAEAQPMVAGVRASAPEELPANTAAAQRQADAAQIPPAPIDPPQPPAPGALRF
jgi:glutaredoxin